MKSADMPRVLDAVEACTQELKAGLDVDECIERLNRAISRKPKKGD